MPPKKGQKMSLGAFLDDGGLGSWADEMDSLPTAPSQRGDMDSQAGRLGGRAADSGLSRGDRAGFPPREDLPMPTQPPYTAFIGNLAFDLTESELEQFFSPLKTKSVKLIRDRDEKPKGFGYIEFEDLDGLKDALSRSGQSMAGRGIRVSVAEPPKERSGFGGSGGGFDEEKFANPWRRDGPLPDLPGRDGSRRRVEGGERTGPPPSSASDNVDQWRSSRPSPRLPARELDGPPLERRRSSFQVSGEASPADTEEMWTRGGRFKPTEDPPASRLGGGGFRRGDMGPPREPPAPSPAEEPINWRSARPARLNSTSPTNSTPPTPQMGRRKLELLPRATGASAGPSPLSSPRMAHSPSGSSTPRSNPFGDARPVDVSAKEKEITHRLEKDREVAAARGQTMSRTSSRTAIERTTSKPGMSRTSAAAASASTIRPAVSFASALGNSDPSEDLPASAATDTATDTVPEAQKDDVNTVADELKNTTI